MSIPLFPNLKPRLMHSSWFDVDQPCDDEDEVSQMEREHQNWLQMITQRNSDLTPIGKTASENMEEDEEEDDEDDNDDDDESETHDEEEEDEIEMDVSQERNSPVDVSIRLVQGHGVR
ncbi:anaphase-promoting complex subunit 15 [Anoplophora glabripennis]|uniref:anaphase-promoting complex subunit 15 n=1 Tax=Anoplophora glabripennis TaxID=217634 RepID=UPI0008748BF3|nr:anaphase-promoting complex subunit 15 [Anoplophora glabripennis]